MKISPTARIALTSKPTVIAIDEEEGRPGGPNNDRLRLHLDDGLVISVNSYSGGDMDVRVSLDRGQPRSVETLSMKFRDFEERIVPAKKYPQLQSDDARLLYESNGVAGEGGEVANAVKKMFRDGASFDNVVKECGDVLFYMHRLLKLRGLRVEDAANALLEKLDRLRGEQIERSGR